MNIASDDTDPGAEATLGEDVFKQLLAFVLSNELPADSRVNINRIAKQLDVSPTPIREALTRLEVAGLVTKTHLKGFRTTSVLSEKELADLFVLRLLLEPTSAALAAEHATPAELNALTAELNSYTDAPETGDAQTMARFSEHDGRLHLLIAQASGNLAIQRALEQTHFHLHAFRLSYEKAAGDPTLLEHVAVVEAITAREPEAAAAAMRAHLAASRERLLPRARALEAPSQPR
ncbi:GntR family transcriptional regulator [Leucobacter sp. M11]|uniref:GntR family transcriptional regulator n=1 Tax=Leucobacter sp. M11 TaxID=2993565 RepID=UPI002D7EE64C|nr:GntR family transcriptional regulator [Leucobacter sp. M11]MEB4614811.1 GntR family transcriptional regulator [Leucobacter sp. M11]